MNTQTVKVQSIPYVEGNTEYIADGMTGSERNVKRLGDMCIAAVCLIVFSPLFLICYILVRREDGGPGHIQARKDRKIWTTFLYI